MMRHFVETFAVAAFALAWLAPGTAKAEACAAPANALGVERIVEIDAATGPLYGDISVLTREDTFLRPREVVLTFDDGPMPWITKSILDTLDRFCTKATFFSVGRMAVAYPATVKDVLARGHTLGTHTWSHPLNLKRRSLARAIEEIERGFAAVAMAAGQPIAPFFRFPGLSDSDPMLAHLQQRGIATFTVDVVSNDSYIGGADRLATRTLAEIDKRQGGIVLFHDIKSATAKALPVILAGLKQRGYSVVHMRPKAPFVPLSDYDAELAAIMAKATPAAKQKTAPPVTADAAPDATHLYPFFGSPAVLKTLQGADAEVTMLAPPARPRAAANGLDHAGRDETTARPAKSERRAQHRPQRSKPGRVGRATATEPAPFSFFGF